MRSCTASLPFLFLFVTLARPAAADEASPAGYRTEVEGNTVTICPHARNDRACPQPEGMLRQDVQSGEVRRLPQNCTNRRLRPGSPGQQHHGACYIDECVAPGTYRYGYARPLECIEDATTEYFAEATVTAPLAKDCQRSGGGTLTTVKQAPWGTSPYLCVAGCGFDFASSPQLTWGLILLLVFGASLVVLYHRYGRGPV